MRAAEATNGSAVKLVAEVVIQEYVTHFATQVAEATISSPVNGVAEVVTQEYVTRFVVLAAEATNTLQGDQRRAQA
jgi:hypothetical protein